ncbi:MAG: 2-oxo acid dehydrogenase subunit E2 [Cytophagales bacterium]|nr:2-oxo acid dehydrogenase subunit E2 [Armatimonadota bacterium]
MRFTVVLPFGLANPENELFTLAAWRKEIGELVQQGEAIAVVTPFGGGSESEVPSPAFGILARKSVLPGDHIETGEPLGILSGVPAPLRGQAGIGVPPSFTALIAAASGPETAVPLSKGDRLLARHNARSVRASPHVVTVAAVNLGEVVRLRERVAATLAQREGISLTLLPFVLSVTGTALPQYPEMNARLQEKADEIRRYDSVNLAFAIRTPDGGLATPVIHDPQKKSILGLAREVFHLTARAHSNALRPDETRGATFTITESPSVEGVLWQTPIIHQPQAAILAFGAVACLPVALDNETVAVRPVLHLCLAHDARIVSEEIAARFLASVKRGLEEAQFLFA